MSFTQDEIHSQMMQNLFNNSSSSFQIDSTLNKKHFISNLHERNDISINRKLMAVRIKFRKHRSHMKRTYENP